MAITTTILSIVVAILAVMIAAAWYTDTLKPVVVYYYTYATEGRSQAEEKALDMMGESKLSYGLKDQIKRNKMTGIKELDDMQDGVGDLVGDQVGKGGIGEDLGKGLSKAL